MDGYPPEYHLARPCVASKCRSANSHPAGSLVWNDLFMGREDEAPAMFMPLVFAYHMLVLQALMLLGAAGGVWLCGRRDRGGSGKEG